MQDPHYSLSYYQAYTCPVCRHGKISALPLMEAFACSFCRHIFTANLEKQAITMADGQLPLTWYWTGRNWQGMTDQNRFGLGYGLGAIAFVLLPTAIVGLGAYLFPPLPGSRLSWFPLFWTGLTLLAHLACLLWLILEYYQFPLYLYLQALRQRNNS
ncbi:conserved hypothetical protein [Rippkaea orientalis PCC 8801]|uniref:Uncharacterized protein n=1 Tax=Rippkaea orientalis (strain PCC 8801 / RF-1) TaxID=41431 RepID=B7K3P5_RIPO1|nr:hypothetical protein [Rippkaea orientalis]ACK65387.1 conserved hypothetical protein [Rippkaea orientalis PCC 8801]